MDETWIHYYTSESKRPSAEWTATSERRPKRPKTLTLAGKKKEADVNCQHISIVFLVTLAVTGVSSFFIIKKKVVKQRTESMKSRQRMAEARLSKAV
ncbi:hypothetical protein TNCV_4203761 [Trichonephila clavipes]|nr:hypothetical protein TNCV_4203761 [Trichonephila clavipes]